MTAPSTTSRARFATARLATGPQIHFAEQGDLGGEAMIFVHGWPDSWFSLSRVLRAAARRYHAFAFDQRGFGDSARRPPATDRAARADIVAFMDAVGIGSRR